MYISIVYVCVFFTLAMIIRNVTRYSMEPTNDVRYLRTVLSTYTAKYYQN